MLEQQKGENKHIKALIFEFLEWHTNISTNMSLDKASQLKLKIKKWGNKLLPQSDNKDVDLRRGE